MMTFPAPTDVDTKRITDLAVETVNPLCIVLFGSADRGELRDDSDLDLKVVVPHGTSTLRTEQDTHVALARLRETVGAEFVVTTPSRFEERKNALGSVYREISRDGRELDAA